MLYLDLLKVVKHNFDKALNGNTLTDFIYFNFISLNE